MKSKEFLLKQMNTYTHPIPSHSTPDTPALYSFPLIPAVNNSNASIAELYLHALSVLCACGSSGGVLVNDLGKWWEIGSKRTHCSHAACCVMTVVCFLAVQEQESISFGKNHLIKVI